MSIQAYSAASLLQAYSVASAINQKSAATMPQGQATSPDPAMFADKVTISQEARDASAAPAETEASVQDNPLSKIAHSLSPQDAAKFVKDMTYARDGALVSLEGPPGSIGPWKYAATGEAVTEESESYFNGLEPTVRQGRIELYESEVAKKTPPAEIMDKILNYQRQQPY